MIWRSALFAALIAGTAGAQTLPEPLTDADFAPVNFEEAALGQLLFYDPILSGNRNIACATCHHPALGTADGMALGLGEGAVGLGTERRVDPNHPPEERIPRNAPALFNLGAHEFTVMFHDGRLEADPNAPNGIRTPMDADMVQGFASILSAQTMFPVLSRDEMAGNHRENDVGRAVRQGIITGPGGAWDLISRRVANIPAYAQQFISVYPHIKAPEDIAFTDVSNAIAMFVAFEWRSDETPFDQLLAGTLTLRAEEQRGLELFYGRGGCSACHSGPFMTDHRFHAMGAPQIGPGKAATFETHTRDTGRFRVTGALEDLYAFRTPSLRNLIHTAPYGHAGSHMSLRAFIADHSDPVAGLSRFDPKSVTLPPLDGARDFEVMRSDADRKAIAAAVRTMPVVLTDAELDDLVAFLQLPNDNTVAEGRLGVPKTVPSGLPVPNP